MPLLIEGAVHTRKHLLRRHAARTERSEARAALRHNKYFPHGPNSRSIRALLYTHTSKTTKSQYFPLLLWTEAQPAHTPVRTQAYGPAPSQSNFSTLSAFCLVHNNKKYYAPIRIRPLIGRRTRIGRRLHANQPLNSIGTKWERSQRMSCDCG